MGLEYKTIWFRKQNFFSWGIDTRSLDEKINEYAGKGWEFVSLNFSSWPARWGVLIVFKRDVTDSMLR